MPQFNAFEAGARKVIPAVLVYVRWGNSVLMIHRVNGTRGSGAIDYHSGKWNGLGGKLEVEESPLEAAQRELKEESKLVFPEDRFQALGVLQFPNFKAHRGEDWVVFVFSVELDPNEACPEIEKTTSEGELHWVPAQEILGLNLWPGDRHFIPWVLENRPFLGTIWYQGQEVIRHWVAPLAGS